MFSVRILLRFGFADEEDDARSKAPVPRCHFVRERTPASQVSGENTR